MPLMLESGNVLSDPQSGVWFVMIPSFRSNTIILGPTDIHLFSTGNHRKTEAGQLT